LAFVNFLYKYFIINGFHVSFFHFEYAVSTAEICQLIGIVTYTVLNFILNKYFTFKK
jgi:putative flippase GtrA